MNRIYLGIGIAALVVATVVMAFFQGKDHERKIWLLKPAAAEKKISDLESKQPVINEVIVTQYVDRIRYVDRIKVQERVVKEFITVEADQNCTINNGFVTLHNAAAIPIEPPEPKPIDAEPSDTKLSEVALVVTDNYAKYHQVKAQLEALQQWIREQQKLWKQYE